MAGELLDPEIESILVAAGKAAASAVGGMVVRASADTWNEALRKTRPAPSKVRRLASWKLVKVANRQQSQIVKFLGSRTCTGLLEVLAYVHFQDQEKANSDELAQIKESFRNEITRYCSKINDDAIGRIWTSLNGAVRLHVLTLRRKDAFSVADILFSAQLMKRMPVQKGEKLPSPRFILDRADVAASQERSSRVVVVVEMIRSAMAKNFEKILMPQVRDDHQIAIRDLYIDRRLCYRSSETIVSRSEGLPTSNGMDLPENAESDASVDEEGIVDRRLAIIGNPGAGKSTLVRHLVYSLSASERGSESAIAPMIIELKNHATANEPWVTILAKRLSVVAQEEINTQEVHDILVLGFATVVFDGLDEISSIEQRRQAVQTIHRFAHRYPLVQIIVTSREEGFLGARLDEQIFPVYQLPDFTDSQVELYASRWFKLVNRLNTFDPEERSRNFLRDSDHVRDLRTNPLLLALLCAIYDYDGYIPENRPSIYQQCADLLLERWDRQRGVQVSFKTSMDIRYLIQELAYHFFSRQRVQSGETELGLKALIRDFVERQVTGDRILAQHHAEEFLEYCAGRAWVLSRVGRNDRGERLFGFTHRTFMEYFAACYLVRHNSGVEGLVSRITPMIESGASDVVPQIAIQELNVRMADGIDHCFTLIVFGSLTVRRSVSAVGLKFVVRSLRFMRPTPRILREILNAAVEKFSHKWDASLLSTLIGTDGPSRHVLSEVCREVIEGRTISDRYSARAVAGAAAVTAMVGVKDIRFAVRANVSNRRSVTGGFYVDDEVSNRVTALLGGRRAPVVAPLNGRTAAAQEAYLAGFIKYGHLLELVGPHALFAGSGMKSTRGVFFEMTLHRAIPDIQYVDDLEKMQRLLVRSPDTVLPLGQGIVHELLSSVDRWAVSVDAMRVPKVHLESRAAFILGLSSVCACAEWGWDWTGLATYMNLEIDDMDDVERLMRPWSDDKSLPVAWRKVLRSRIHRKRRFGVEVESREGFDN